MFFAQFCWNCYTSFLHASCEFLISFFSIPELMYYVNEISTIWIIGVILNPLYSSPGKHSTRGQFQISSLCDWRCYFYSSFFCGETIFCPLEKACAKNLRAFLLVFWQVITMFLFSHFSLHFSSAYFPFTSNIHFFSFFFHTKQFSDARKHDLTFFSHTK